MAVTRRRIAFPQKDFRFFDKSMAFFEKVQACDGYPAFGVLTSMDVSETRFSFCRSDLTLAQKSMDISLNENPFRLSRVTFNIEEMTLTRRPDPDAVVFGAILRRERQSRGWTLRKLAQRAGMNAQYLGVVEAGGNVPSLSLILEVAEVLGADAGEMIREAAIARRTPKK
jgi:DNA-binding XRE family transcriptional regulator